nr:MAG TPA: hypothetical protein [Caudoviricetes sp.]
MICYSIQCRKQNHSCNQQNSFLYVDCDCQVSQPGSQIRLIRYRLGTEDRTSRKYISEKSSVEMQGSFLCKKRIDKMELMFYNKHMNGTIHMTIYHA